MDIDLLSKMVKELILDNDRVVLPGLGCFVAEMVPSTFSDKGYTINPPYRRLYFRARPDQGDELTKLYAQGNGIEMQIADKIITDFIAELKTVLFSKKTVVFPGLGRLRATKENTVFFVADEDLDIYPAGFGLEPVSLKTHQESASEVTAAVEGLKHLLGEPAPQPEPVPQPEPEIEPEKAEEAEPIVETEAVEIEETQPEMTEEPEPIVEPESIVEPEPVDETAVEPEVEPIIEPAAEPAVEPAVEPEVEPIDEPAVEAEAEPVGVPTTKGNKALKKVLITLLIIILVLAVLLGAYIALGRFAPDFLDQFLYTKEELEILNYRP